MIQHQSIFSAFCQKPSFLKSTLTTLSQRHFLPFYLSHSHLFGLLLSLPVSSCVNALVCMFCAWLALWPWKEQVALQVQKLSVELNIVFSTTFEHFLSPVHPVAQNRGKSTRLSVFSCLQGYPVHHISSWKDTPCLWCYGNETPLCTQLYKTKDHFSHWNPHSSGSRSACHPASRSPWL